MNKQGKMIGGKVVGGIEWTKTVHPDGTETQGYTWNPVKGCQHGCRWTMPDGSTALCYAEEVAEGVAAHAYPMGFDWHYFTPYKLREPLSVKKPARIFMDSMSDLMGHWVSDEEIQQVLDTCTKAYWHTFQLLTKNAPRLLKFKFPPNVWVGASLPPTWFKGKLLSQPQQVAMLARTLSVLTQVEASVRWISFEPLSWDCSSLVAAHPTALQWAVIGAASHGKKTFQPNPDTVNALLGVLDAQNVPVFFKGNLKWAEWREQFPQMNALV